MNESARMQNAAEDCGVIGDIPGEEPTKAPWYRRFTTADVFVVGLLAWWGTQLTWAGGGKDPKVLSIAAVLCAVAVLLVRPWRQLPMLVLVLASGVAVGAWVVVATAPTGWGGANDAATYTVAAGTFLVVAAWAKTERRIWLVVGVVLITCGLEFAKAIWPWLGSETPTTPMVGTFYYLNSFGAFMIPGALLGATVAICEIKPLRVLGLVIAPLSVAAVLFSTSKASLVILGVGIAAVTILAVIVYRWGGLLRASIVWLIAAGVCLVLPGPPFFLSDRILPGDSTALRAAAGSGIAKESFVRFEWWVDSLSIFARWPFSGGGFHSIASASAEVGAPIPSAFVHNSYLQALAEGGLVLAIPFWTACVGIALLCLRSIWRAARYRRMMLEAGIAVSVLALMLHAGFDWDWTYPVSIMGTAILAALLISRRSEKFSPRTPAIGWSLTAAMVCSLTLSVIAAWGGNQDFSF